MSPDTPPVNWVHQGVWVLIMGDGKTSVRAVVSWDKGTRRYRIFRDAMRGHAPVELHLSARATGRYLTEHEGRRLHR